MITGTNKNICFPRSVLVVKLVKGENIPTQNLFSSKPSVEIQVLPARAEPGSGLGGIEFEIDEDELLRQTVHFCVCRYDRFSRKTTIGDVFLSLADLTAEGVDLSQEIFIRNAIEPNIEVRIALGFKLLRFQKNIYPQQ